ASQVEAEQGGASQVEAERRGASQVGASEAEPLGGASRALSGGVASSPRVSPAVPEAIGMSPHRPAFAAARTRNRRELDADSGWIELPGAGPWTASVRVIDVLGGESWHTWRIEHVC
ncbi:hypothetical protein SAMN02745121_02999, partial [Nannocystis exedens]